MRMSEECLENLEGSRWRVLESIEDLGGKVNFGGRKMDILGEI